MTLALYAAAATMETMGRYRIREEAKAQGKTLEKLAEEIGLSQSYFSRLASGNRKMKVEVLDAIAKALNRPMSALLADTGGMVTAPVIGRVQAGNWQEMDNLDEALEELTIPADPRLRAAPVAFRVRGDSYDKFVKDGGYVIGFRYGDAPGDLRAGMTVVAERERSGLVERTLKMVEVKRSAFELQPRSTNKKHRPIRFPSTEGEEITRVYAIITTFVQPAEWK